MAIRKLTAVQYPMSFVHEITFEDVGDELVIDLPSHFIYTGLGTVNVITAFNGTTPTISVVDNAGTPNTYLASTALTAGVKAMDAAEANNYYPSGARISILPVVASGTPTAGRAIVTFTGVVLGRQNERVGSQTP